jgi:ABC-type transport system substrate-binding protein
MEYSSVVRTLLFLLILGSGCVASQTKEPPQSTAPSQTPEPPKTDTLPAPPPPTNYSGTFYVTGNGRHLARVLVSIDTSDTANPITTGTPSKIDLDATSTYTFHDNVSTPDGRYAVLALQVDDVNGMRKDGHVQLYDIVNKAVVGNSVSVCAVCHPSGSRLLLDGLDVTWD